MTLRVKNLVTGNERRFYLPCPRDGGVRGSVDGQIRCALRSLWAFATARQATRSSVLR